MQPPDLRPDQGPGWTRSDVVAQGLAGTVHDWLAGRTLLTSDQPLRLVLMEPPDGYPLDSTFRRLVLQTWRYQWPAPWTERPYRYVARVAVDEDRLPVAVGPAVPTYLSDWTHPDDWEAVPSWAR